MHGSKLSSSFIVITSQTVVIPDCLIYCFQVIGYFQIKHVLWAFGRALTIALGVKLVVSTIDNNVETPFYTQLFIEHFPDGLDLFPSVRVSFSVMQEINNFVVFRQFIDEMNQIPKIQRPYW